MQLFILRNFLIPSPTPYLLGAKVLFAILLPLLANHKYTYKLIQLHEIIVKEMDPEVTNSEYVLKLEVGFLGCTMMPLHLPLCRVE